MKLETDAGEVLENREAVARKIEEWSANFSKFKPSKMWRAFASIWLA